MPRKLRVESFKASADKRAEPFGIDYAYSDVRSVLFGKLFKMVCDRCWHVPRRHDCQRSNWFRKPTRQRLRLKNCLSEEGDQSIASAFRRRLDLNDIFLVPSGND
ncbi:MAG: hypothetical protein ABSH09_28030 [Bryobacteraceae bacterium]